MKDCFVKNSIQLEPIIFIKSFQKRRWSLNHNFLFEKLFSTNWDNENLWPAIKNYNLVETTTFRSSCKNLFATCLPFTLKAELLSVEFPLSNRGSYGGSSSCAYYLFRLSSKESYLFFGLLQGQFYFHFLFIKKVISITSKGPEDWP